MSSSPSRSRRSTPSNEAFTPEVGAEPFPGYRLVRLRGRGAFAGVWEATTPAGTRVALKFMSSQNSGTTARELRSLQAITKLAHSNLLQTRDVWSVPGYIVIGMDLADASLLDLFLLYAEEFQTPVDPAKVILYLFQAAEALDFLNARKHIFDGRTIGYQHGDIKPNNILLVGESAKLADYGLATPMLQSNTPIPRQGTLEYAAPEIFQGYLTDTSDQFSLAVTYYLLRTGAFPYPPPPKAPPRGYQRQAPDLGLLTAEEQPVVCKALGVVPQDRHASCVDMIRLLAKALKLDVIRHPERGLMVQSMLTPALSTLRRPATSTQMK